MESYNHQLHKLKLTLSTLSKSKNVQSRHFDKTLYSTVLKQASAGSTIERIRKQFALHCSSINNKVFVLHRVNLVCLLLCFRVLENKISSGVSNDWEKSVKDAISLTVEKYS